MKAYPASLRLYLSVLLGLLILLTEVKGQEPFLAIPRDKVNDYHLNFTQFFTSPEAEKKDLENLDLLFTRFYALKHKVTRTAGNLLRSLKTWDSLLIMGNRHYIYHNLRYAVNRNDIQSKNTTETIDASLSEKSVFLKREISGLTSSQLASFVKQEPALKKYWFFCSDQLRFSSHQVSLESEELLAGLQPITKGWQFELYEKIGKGIVYDSVKAPSRAKDSAMIQPDRDSIIRAEGFKKYYKGLASARSMYAFNLIKLVQTEDKLARIHHFPDAAESYYFEKYHSKSSIRNILNQIIDSVQIYKHYQLIKAEFVKKNLGYPEIHYWDLGFSVKGINPKFSIDSATVIIKKALLPLGNEYQQELTKLLNPRNGRMEIAPSPTKRSGGFSRGYIGTPSIFYSGAYAGSYNDVRVLVHESTHAVHRELMNQNKVLPPYISGPNYFFESFAIFSEFLFYDYLLKEAKTPDEKRFYLEKFFEGKGMALFHVAPEALLEQSIHEGIAKGTIQNANDLDSLNAVINRKFSIWSPEQYPELNMRWITASLFYEDPFYEINYVLGAMLALKFMELYERGPESFAKNYIALLKNGFNDEPSILLKKFLDIDINSPALLTDAMKLISKRVGELEVLYKSDSGK